jgi:ubiquinone/menaquinone biosynthesis C-methylase UbiE
MSIENENLSGKVILEVGSGRGDTTRKLVDCLAGQPNSQLIVTDISDRVFPSLQDEFQAKGVNIRFIRTGAQDLEGIVDGSIDFIVCNYTLCAVNSQAGLVALALKRFWEVLKSNGKLFVDDEFPPNKQDSFLRDIWAEKWRILKSSMILTGQSIFNEISPEVLENLCYLAGFNKVEWTAKSEIYRGGEVLNFFQQRLDKLLKEMPNENLRAGFTEMAVNLQSKAAQAGGMEVPFYRLVAQKTAG